MARRMAKKDMEKEEVVMSEEIGNENNVEKGAGADFSIQEDAEEPSATPEAMMFDADTKITPALIMERARALEEQRKQKRAAVNDENREPRVETRAEGRRVVRHN